MRLVHLKTNRDEAVDINPGLVTHITEAPSDSTRIHFINREFIVVAAQRAVVAAHISAAMQSSGYRDIP
jgi:hypothetical protein